MPTLAQIQALAAADSTRLIYASDKLAYYVIDANAPGVTARPVIDTSGLLAQIVELGDTVDAQGGSIAINTAAISDLGGALATLDGEVVSINTQLGTINGQISTQSATISGHTTSIGSLTTTVSGHTTSINTLINTVGEHASAISDLTNTASEHTTSISDLDTTKADLESPQFTGTPTLLGDDQSLSLNNGTLATTKFVQTLVGAISGTINTGAYVSYNTQVLDAAQQLQARTNINAHVKTTAVSAPPLSSGLYASNTLTFSSTVTSTGTVTINGVTVQCWNGTGIVPEFHLLTGASGLASTVAATALAALINDHPERFRCIAVASGSAVTVYAMELGDAGELPVSETLAMASWGGPTTTKLNLGTAVTGTPGELGERRIVTTTTTPIVYECVSSPNHKWARVTELSYWDVAGLIDQLAAKADLESPQFTGTPALDGPDQSTELSDGTLATTKFVQTLVAGIEGGGGTGGLEVLLRTAAAGPPTEGSGAKASATIAPSSNSSITYEAKNVGVAGNNISITYNAAAATTATTVAVVGTAIAVTPGSQASINFRSTSNLQFGGFSMAFNEYYHYAGLDGNGNRKWTTTNQGEPCEVWYDTGYWYLNWYSYLFQEVNVVLRAAGAPSSNPWELTWAKAPTSTSFTGGTWVIGAALSTSKLVADAINNTPAASALVAATYLQTITKSRPVAPVPQTFLVGGVDGAITPAGVGQLCRVGPYTIADGRSENYDWFVAETVSPPEWRKLDEIPLPIISPYAHDTLRVFGDPASQPTLNGELLVFPDMARVADYDGRPAYTSDGLAPYSARPSGSVYAECFYYAADGAWWFNYVPEPGHAVLTWGETDTLAMAPDQVMTWLEYPPGGVVIGGQISRIGALSVIPGYVGQLMLVGDLPPYRRFIAESVEPVVWRSVDELPTTEQILDRLQGVEGGPTRIGSEYLPHALSGLSNPNFNVFRFGTSANSYNNMIMTEDGYGSNTYSGASSEPTPTRVRHDGTQWVMEFLAGETWQQAAVGSDAPTPWESFWSSSVGMPHFLTAAAQGSFTGQLFQRDGEGWYRFDGSAWVRIYDDPPASLTASKVVGDGSDGDGVAQRLQLSYAEAYGYVIIEADTGNSYMMVEGATEPSEPLSWVQVGDRNIKWSEITVADGDIPFAKLSGAATAAQGTKADNAVRFDTAAQGLNDTQKGNARANIGAATAEQGNGAVRFDVVQELTSTRQDQARANIKAAEALENLSTSLPSINVDPHAIGSFYVLTHATGTVLVVNNANNTATPINTEYTFRRGPTAGPISLDVTGVATVRGAENISKVPQNGTFTLFKTGGFTYDLTVMGPSADGVISNPAAVTGAVATQVTNLVAITATEYANIANPELTGITYIVLPD